MVDLFHHLLHHGQGRRILSIVLAVRRCRHAARLAVKKQRLWVQTVGSWIFLHLRPDSGPGQGNFCGHRKLRERRDEAAQIKYAGHGRVDVANSVWMLSHDHACFFVDASGHVRGHRVHQVLALVPRSTGHNVGHFIGISRRHDRDEIYRLFDHLGFASALALHIRNATSAFDAHAREGFFVFLVADDNVSKLEKAVHNLLREWYPHLATISHDKLVSI